MCSGFCGCEAIYYRNDVISLPPPPPVQATPLDLGGAQAVPAPGGPRHRPLSKGRRSPQQGLPEHTVNVSEIGDRLEELKLAYSISGVSPSLIQREIAPQLYSTCMWTPVCCRFARLVIMLIITNWLTVKLLYLPGTAYSTYIRSDCECTLHVVAAAQLLVHHNSFYHDSRHILWSSGFAPPPSQGV